jgi:hypothetical protein
MPRKPGRKKGPASKTAVLRRKRFAAEVIKAVANGETLADAAQAVGLSPNGAGPAGSRMLGHPEVQAELARRIGPGMGQDEIIERLTKIAEAKRPSKIVIEDTFMSVGATLEPVRKKRREYSPESALNSLAKIRGLLKDTAAPSVNQTQINVLQVLDAMTVDQLSVLLSGAVPGENGNGNGRH